MPNNFKEELAYAYTLYKSELAKLANGFVHAPDIAEELVQDVFLAILINNVKINKLKNYLFRAVKNKAKNTFKRKRIETKYNSQNSVEIAQVIETEFPANIPANILTCLSPQQLRIFTLNREGLSYRKIAIAEKLSVKTVNTHMHRALAKLRRHKP